MAQPRTKLSVPTPKSDEDLPIVETVGLAKVGRGWVVVVVSVQGDKVVDREVISRDPEGKVNACKRGMAEFVKTFLAPESGSN